MRKGTVDLPYFRLGDRSSGLRIPTAGIVMEMISTQALLNWTRLDTWCDLVLSALLKNMLPNRNLAWLRSLPSPSPCWDDSRRLDPIHEEAGIQDHDEFVGRCGAALLLMFDRLRVVHLCRPVDFSTYLKHGLHCMNPAELQEDFIRFFGSPPKSLIGLAGTL
jgi:hypothetical protein